MNKKAGLALKVLVSVSQCTPNRPVTAEQLSHLLGLSMSTFEVLIRPLRREGYVFSFRGPSGGYLPGPKLSSATAGDVCKLFCESDWAHDDAIAPRTPAEETIVEISRQMRAIEMEFLQNYPLVKFTSCASKSINADSPSPNVLKIAPVVRPLKPNAPNSIFELARFGKRNRKAVSL